MRMLPILLAMLSLAGTPQPQETRSFKVASAPLQLDLHDSLLFSFEFDSMAGNLDMISMHQDFFGIPWIELMAGDPLPPSWVAHQVDLKARADATGLPVYLSLTPLSSDGRNALSPYVEEKDGGFRLVDGWSPPCFDFDDDPMAQDVRRAYLDYVDFMIELFEPQYVTTFIEINLYNEGCSGGWDALVGFANEVYDHVKTARPELVVFPSVQVDAYWSAARQICPGDPAPCIDGSLDEIRSLSMDRFGISTYPLSQLLAYDSIPPDWISIFAGLVGQPLAIAETGVNSLPVTLSLPPPFNPCRTVLFSSNAYQRYYMDLLFSDADSLDMDLVTWWSFRDYLPRGVAEDCPCPPESIRFCSFLSLLGPFNQAVFRFWGNMGVLYNDGTEKPVYDFWRSWLDRPLR